MTAPHTLRDALGRPVSLGKELTKDENNALYLITRREGSIAKIWFDPLETYMADKLLAAVQLRSSALEDACAWPLSTLHDQKTYPVGFVMLQVNTSEFRPLNELYAPNAPRFPRTWSFRIQVASRVAQAFAALHAAGQVMGDTAERHILVSSGGQVRLVGVDHYQIAQPAGQSAGQPLGPQPGQPLSQTMQEANEGKEAAAPRIFPATPALLPYTPPELQAGGVAARIRTPNHDLFGLAVLIFRVLFGGHHPYSGVPVGRPMPSPGEAIAQGAFAYAQQPQPFVRRPPGTASLDVLPPEVAQLFEAAFGHNAARPSAHTWQAALASMAQQLEPCPQDSQHQRVRGLPCPVCEAQASTLSPAQSPRADLSGAINRMWAQVQAVSVPEKPPVLPPEVAAPRLPPLPLNLPSPPRSLVRPEALETALRWILRLAALTLLMTVIYLIQKSVLAAVVEVGIVLLVMTLGRRVSVDWDGLIDSFQNAEGRFVERLLPARGQWQTYHTALEQRRNEIRLKFNDLREQYKALEDRYAEQHAYARYMQELARLEQMRRSLTQEDDTSSSVQALIDAQASEALSEYLKRQTIAPNVIPGLTARTALNLTNMGLRRASDVQGDKLGLVRSDLAQALTQWRGDLVDFFQFDPGSVSTQQIELAQQRQQQQKATTFRQLSQDVTQFVQTDWHNQEDDLLNRMRELKGQAKQYQNALKEMDKALE